MGLHQEETRTPRGVHCPKACLHRSQGVATGPRAFRAQRSRMLHTLACLPVLPSGPPSVTTQGRKGFLLRPVCWLTPGHVVGPHSNSHIMALPARAWGGTCEPGLGTSPEGHIICHGSFGCPVIYHLAHGRLTRIQRLFGAEACSTPVLNHTQRGFSTLHLMEYLLLQPRSAPGGTRVGIDPNGHCGLPCPAYTTMLCSAATAVADCKAISASLTWAPSIFGAAYFGR